ncbi:hypothetical protein NCC49_001577 [Naganishia albida]|nr:hypothetical protein NCC49_001577 [Naganishia albida]
MLRKLPTTILGNGYELHCLRLLQEQMHMSLTRIGGKGDGGVDLRGWWNMPSPTESTPKTTDKRQRRIRVLAQCKAEKQRPGPKLIREMEGVARREHDLSRDDATIDFSKPGTSASESILALLCSRSGFSPNAVVEANRSRIPMLLLHIPFDYEAMLLTMRDPVVTAVDHDLLDTIPRTVHGAFWNAPLIGSRGLLGAEWELRKEFTGDVVDDFRIAIHRNGQRL